MKPTELDEQLQKFQTALNDLSAWIEASDIDEELFADSMELLSVIGGCCDDLADLLSKGCTE